MPPMLEAHLCFHSVFSFFLQSPILDLTRSKPDLGQVFPAPLNPMLPEAFFLRPLLSRNQPVPAVDMYFASPCCSLTPTPVSLCGPHNLVVPHLRLHPVYLMCKGALGFVLRMPESIVVSTVCRIRWDLIFGRTLRNRAVRSRERAQLVSFAAI